MTSKPITAEICIKVIKCYQENAKIGDETAYKKPIYYRYLLYSTSNINIKIK